MPTSLSFVPVCMLPFSFWHHRAAKALRSPISLHSLGVSPSTHARQPPFLFSGGKFHLTLSSGAGVDIRFVDAEVLSSEFSKRGTMKRLQLFSYSVGPFSGIICIYKRHISESLTHLNSCAPLCQPMCTSLRSLYIAWRKTSGFWWTDTDSNTGGSKLTRWSFIFTPC